MTADGPVSGSTAPQLSPVLTPSSLPLDASGQRRPTSPLHNAVRRSAPQRPTTPPLLYVTPPHTGSAQNHQLAHIHWRDSKFYRGRVIAGTARPIIASPSRTCSVATCWCSAPSRREQMHGSTRLPSPADGTRRATEYPCFCMHSQASVRLTPPPQMYSSVTLILCAPTSAVLRSSPDSGRDIPRGVCPLLLPRW